MIREIARIRVSGVTEVGVHRDELHCTPLDPVPPEILEEAGTAYRQGLFCFGPIYVSCVSGVIDGWSHAAVPYRLAGGDYVDLSQPHIADLVLQEWKDEPEADDYSWMRAIPDGTRRLIFLPTDHQGREGEGI
jgi:hypothetical protein